MDRVMVFIDGSNNYHILEERFGNSQSLNNFKYEKFIKEIVGDRKLIRVHYYNCPLDKGFDEERYKKQQRFFDIVNQLNSSVCFIGLLDSGTTKSSRKTLLICCTLKRITCFQTVLCKVLCRMQKVKIKGQIIYQTKKEDISLAVDLVELAYKNAYDIAIVISSNGDFVPAILYVKETGKNIENMGFEKKFSFHLQQICDKFIKFKKDKFLQFFN